MMERRTVRCFGGPLHDKVVTVDTFPFFAYDTYPTPRSWTIDNQPELTDTPYRKVRYDLERFWIHDEINCLNQWAPRRTRYELCRHDPCIFIGGIAVGDGYNAQHVASMTLGLYWFVTGAIGAKWVGTKVAPG